MTAAVKAGADACYAGGSRFGARAYAANFTDEELLEAIDFSHIHGTKLYLTINTLFKEDEIKQLYDYIAPFYKNGLDAVIVQDVGVFDFIRREFPDIAVHCSTQMNITSVYGASYMKSKGAARIVTAREMQLNEIKTIKERVDIEIESFVHGAMCYSYSGRCLMSSLAGGRSGNRGRCAQPCRKCYDGDYILSMKDMCSLSHIPELIEAGIDSFKIEGRMKNAYYTASAVDAYRNLCDDYNSGCFSYDKAVEYEFKLAGIYNRGGFCDGYYFTKNGPDMISEKRPNNQGVSVGKVKYTSGGKVYIELTEQLYPMDVLEIKLKNNEIIEITSNIEQNKGETVALNAPRTRDIRQNSTVYRTKCEQILNAVYSLISNGRKTELYGCFCGITGENIHFTVECDLGGRHFFGEAYDICVEPSRNKNADVGIIRDKLNMLGDTDFSFAKLEIRVSEDAFIPAGCIKKVRRAAIDDLCRKIIVSYKRDGER